MSLDIYGDMTPRERELLDDVTEIAAERDAMRRQLADAITTQTQLATLVSDLRAQLHAAGLEPVGQRWARIGVAA
jgi:hypothetical protein